MNKILIVLIFISILLCIFLKIENDNKSFCKKNYKNIEYFLSQKRNYLIFISNKNNSWKTLLNENEKYYITDKGRIKKTNIRKYCIAYANGEILNISENTLDIPDGTFWIEDNVGIGFERLAKDEVKIDSPLITIKNRKYTNSDNCYYSTEIQNNLNCKIYPVAFGGYILQENEYVLCNVIDTAYSAEQFINWYNCKKEYLLPDEVVFDPNNYGDGDSYWIYIFRTEFDELLKVGIKF